MKDFSEMSKEELKKYFRDGVLTEEGKEYMTKLFKQNHGSGAVIFDEDQGLLYASEDISEKTKKDLNELMRKLNELKKLFKK